MVVNIFWFRRDLRLKDNAGLYRALISNHPVLPIFIFDTHILNKPYEKADARVQFIYDSTQNLKEELAGMGAAFKVFYDTPLNAGAAGCGRDAAPYFRIFNPTLQAKKFDPTGEYIRTWVPEYDRLTYPQPVVDHEMARKRCLEAYKKALIRE